MDVTKLKIILHILKYFRAAKAKTRTKNVSSFAKLGEKISNLHCLKGEQNKNTFPTVFLIFSTPLLVHKNL